jgi:hypothetical protein
LYAACFDEHPVGNLIPFSYTLPQDDVAACFDYYAGLAVELDAKQGTVIDVGSADFEVKVRREPLGVVGLITPWNYPLLVSGRGEEKKEEEGEEGMLFLKGCVCVSKDFLCLGFGFLGQNHAL